MGQHADYSPSRLSRIIACPGSVRLIEAMKRKGTIPIDSPPSPAADEGTRMHKVTERLDLAGAITDNDFFESAEHMNITREDAEVAKECLDYVEVIKNSIRPEGQFIEKAEAVVNLHSFGLPEVWGTSDKTIVALAELSAHVIDYKFGRGVEVSAIENAQLMAYGAGSIGWPTDIQMVHLHIVQPLINNYSTWSISTPGLFHWVHTTLAEAVIKSQTADPLFNPGMPQCQWCEAKNYCKYHYMAVVKQGQEVFQLSKLDASILEPSQIAKVLEYEPLIKKAFKDFATLGFNLLKNGKSFPGYKLVRGRANRSWVNEEQAIKYISEHAPHIDPDTLFKTELLSPAGIEKLSRGLVKDPEYLKLVHKPEGKLTLAVESDARKGVPAPNSAESVFGHLAEK